MAELLGAVGHNAGGNCCSAPSGVRSCRCSVPPRASPGPPGTAAHRQPVGYPAINSQAHRAGTYLCATFCKANLYNYHMHVYKFGGASVRNFEKIKNLATIVQQQPHRPLLIVVSAMGKTTNALEKVAEAFYAGKKEEALELFRTIKLQHLDEAKFLLVTNFNAVLEQFNNFFTEVEWLLHDTPVREYDYYYDQIVCVGELLSTTLVAAWLNESGLPAVWIDVRDVLRTDNTFRDARINWPLTNRLVQEQLAPLLQQHNLVVTQGFIGCTDENESTTLGREGSDYSAAVLANLLNAESLTIWKDVPGVMNADPKQFPDAQYLPELNYEEVIEMAYYGAQVIHPKTIQPLQNKQIPLWVKCFADDGLPGTLIHNRPVKNLPPIIVKKQNQVLLQLSTRDFSFVGEEPMSRLYEMMAQLHIRPNLLHIQAVQIQLCLDNRADKIEQLALKAAAIFDVQVQKGFTLLSIRHYRPGQAEALTSGAAIVLQQQSPTTIQVLYR